MSHTLHKSCVVIYKHAMVKVVEQPSSINYVRINKTLDMQPWILLTTTSSLGSIQAPLHTSSHSYIIYIQTMFVITFTLKTQHMLLI